MTRKEKEQVVEELVEMFHSHENFYVADTSGLTVQQINNFRRLCFQKGLKYRVFKNTLIEKALEKLDADFSTFSEEVLKGVSGILFAGEAANGPAWVIKEFRKSDPEGRPHLKGAYIDSDFFIGDDNLDQLSSLKSKTELIGDIIILLQSPVKNVISALQSSQHKLSGIIKTLSEKQA